ncbi:MAG: DMT family transporter [Pseudomonadota bacterium]
MHAPALALTPIWPRGFVAATRAALHRGPGVRILALMAGAIVLWASWPALATIAHPAPPFLVLGLAAWVGCAVSFAHSAMKGNARIFFALPPATMVLVALGLMGNNAFYLAAIARIGPAEANVVHYLWPVFLVALAALAQKRTPRPFQILGICCGFSGVALALSPQMGAALDLVGVALGICGALTFAVYSLGRARAGSDQNVVGPSLALAGMAALVAHAALEPAYRPSPTQWAAIAAMGIGPFTLANIFWDKATRSGSAAAISSLAFLTPLVAMGLLAAFGLDPVTLAALGGAMLAILGAVLGTRGSAP